MAKIKTEGSEHVSVVESSIRVRGIAGRVFDLILEETKDYDPPNRWLMVSRVISSVFQHHFMLALSAAGGEMTKREDEGKNKQIKQESKDG